MLKQMYKSHPGLFKFSIFILILTSIICVIYVIDSVQKYNRDKTYVGESLLTKDELIQEFDAAGLTQEQIDEKVRSNQNGKTD